MRQTILEKLSILSDAAKYDVSCASSGVDRGGTKGVGNTTSAGICHTWTGDGRCVSLLKILMTNDCVYNCAYCLNRSQNDVPRASCLPEEIVELTMEFYRRNYIEGLFLSSAIEKNPDHTMERMVKILDLLRNTYGFYGYIHVKAIPGANPLLIEQAGYLADRMSVNIELPTKESLRLLAPQKNHRALLMPMQQMKHAMIESKENRKKFRQAPKFTPGGQSTQMIIGATEDSDYTILHTSSALYRQFSLKRIYFSAYVPINTDKNLPAITSAPPLLREHRLYQADWLLRYYHFDAGELLTPERPNFDLDFDPKMIWALNHIEQFPMEINKVSFEELLRIPGIGVTSAYKILAQRKVKAVSYEDLQKMRVSLKRAKYFITCKGKYYGGISMEPALIRSALLPPKEGEQLSFLL